ncbi:unnamed protein product, partial [Pylaiella littoralis]
ATTREPGNGKRWKDPAPVAAPTHSATWPLGPGLAGTGVSFNTATARSDRRSFGDGRTASDGAGGGFHCCGDGVRATPEKRTQEGRDP